MILIEDVLIFHEFSIRDFAGSSGVRDIGLLESAIARPFQTFVVKNYMCHPLIKQQRLEKV